VIADIAMPLLHGLDAGEQIRRIRRTVKIVFVTKNQDRAMAAGACRRGASGYLLKTAAASDLPMGDPDVLSGKTLHLASHRWRFFEFRVEYEGENRLPGPLTPRQKQVLQLLAEGRSMKEVASVLGLTARTVAFHKYRIMELLHVKNSAELLQYAIHQHMIPSS
jgi:DNA-binding NarL/FixJ family response regulator